MRVDPEIYLNTLVFLPFHFSAINIWSILEHMENPLYTTICFLKRTIHLVNVCFHDVFSHDKGTNHSIPDTSQITRAHRISFSSQIELFIIKIIIAVIVYE